MAKNKFVTDLSVEGIENLKQQLLDYKNNYLQQKINLLVRTLAEKGVKIAKANVVKFDAIFTGELLNSIYAKNGISGNGKAVFYIIADNEHAAFVEFGTGQVGLEAPYPFPLPEGVEWQYNKGDTIFEISPGQYGWFYPRDGKWYFTQGMPSRPFMYEASLEVANLVIKTAKEIFK